MGIVDKELYNIIFTHFKLAYFVRKISVPGGEAELTCVGKEGSPRREKEEESTPGTAARN